MIVQISKTGQMKELKQRTSVPIPQMAGRNLNSGDVFDSLSSMNAYSKAAIKRDSERFRKITDLSAKLAAIV